MNLLDPFLRVRLLDPQRNLRLVFQRRLKQAREAQQLSQKELGIQAGLDPFVASTRINGYELGVHQPDLSTV
jgi:transcriptional regulator with XRE-family HTH domain